MATSPSTSQIIATVDDALKVVVPILFNNESGLTDEQWESENVSDVVNLQLKKAWINWILGDVDSIVEKINMGETIPRADMSLNAKMILTNESSKSLSHKLAYEIEPKLRMIKDVHRSIEKLNYLVNNKNDPDYKRCAFDLNTTLQYLMSDVQPQLEQFLNMTDAQNGLAGIEQQLVANAPSVFHTGGKRRSRRRRRSSTKSSKSTKKTVKRRKKRSSKKSVKRHSKKKTPKCVMPVKRRRRSSTKSSKTAKRRRSKRRRSAKPRTRVAW